jgi:hypothetical protein
MRLDNWLGGAIAALARSLLERSRIEAVHIFRGLLILDTEWVDVLALGREV